MFSPLSRMTVARPSCQIHRDRPGTQYSNSERYSNRPKRLLIPGKTPGVKRCSGCWFVSTELQPLLGGSSKQALNSVGSANLCVPFNYACRVANLRTHLCPHHDSQLALRRHVTCTHVVGVERRRGSSGVQHSPVEKLLTKTQKALRLPRHPHKDRYTRAINVCSRHRSCLRPPVSVLLRPYFYLPGRPTSQHGLH